MTNILNGFLKICRCLGLAFIIAGLTYDATVSSVTMAWSAELENFYDVRDYYLRDVAEGRVDFDKKGYVDALLLYGRVLAKIVDGEEACFGMRFVIVGLVLNMIGCLEVIKRTKKESSSKGAIANVDEREE